ncbi:hypothetical protein EC973_008835 [Apophysomyces ossiformis]|uniref:SH3 domain-containing protein n=1 Tax=Apophysomyces ossiformis TaxID=679940 RepID=A0A8H7ET61_9FUNG|nr:hypothetical protein EC973_008835 [Apophysomyces ossiformis]
MSPISALHVGNLYGLFRRAEPSSSNQRENPIKKDDEPISFSNNPTQKITAFPPATTTQIATTTVSPKPTTTLAPSTTTVASPTPTSTSPSSTLPILTESPTATPSTTPSTAANSQADSANSSSGGLSGGVIGAIVAVVIILLLGIGAFIFMRRRQKRKMQGGSRAATMNDQFSFAPNAITTPPMTSYSAAGPAPYTHSQPSASKFEMYHPPSPSQPQQPQQPYDYSPVKPSSFPEQPAMMAAAPAALPQQGVQQQPQQQQPPVAHPAEIWNLPPIATYTIVSTYEPTLSDEIDVQPGDQVQVFEEYDDGWCLGMNLTRGQARGVFPKHCVIPPSPEPLPRQTMESGLVVDNPRLSKRQSSLYNEHPHPPK